MNNRLLLCLGLALLLGACRKDEDPQPQLHAGDYGYQVPMMWNQLYLEVERYCPGYKPPVSARNLGYINLIAYEAVVHGSEGKYRSLSGTYPGFSIDPPQVGAEYNWEACLNAAYDRAFELFFPTAPAEQQFHMLEVSQAMRAEMQKKCDPVVFQRSQAYGQHVAEMVYTWSATDQWGHEAYLHNTDPGYVPPSGTGKWQPTFPDYQPALLPHWGKVRTFAALSSDQMAPPPIFSTDPGSILYQEAVETRDLVEAIRAGGRPEDLWIAQYWSDDCPILTFSPAGRWISITNQVIGLERPDMMETVAAYAKVSLALADAGVKCWQEKYVYNLLRPVDYIRQYLGDADWNTIMCPDGSGGFYTPNFPTYPSGHATFGGAAAAVLSDLFGSTYLFTDRSHQGRTEFNGKPRTFYSFQAMAEENAYSRVPLGVHFQSDSDAGLALGALIGSRVNNLPWQ